MTSADYDDISKIIFWDSLVWMVAFIAVNDNFPNQAFVISCLCACALNIVMAGYTLVKAFRWGRRYG